MIFLTAVFSSLKAGEPPLFYAGLFVSSGRPRVNEEIREAYYFQ